nr:MAG TPA: hypothetical protein [Caudoviricetes sp.]
MVLNVKQIYKNRIKIKNYLLLDKSINEFK